MRITVINAHKGTTQNSSINKFQYNHPSQTLVNIHDMSFMKSMAADELMILDKSIK